MASVAKKKFETKSISKIKKKNKVVVGVVSILATFNNIIITIADTQGNAIISTSSGACGFKGAKRSTPHAAHLTAEFAVKAAMENGMKTVSVVIRGPGFGGEAAVKAVQISGLTIISVRDNTPVPHNGCRLRGKRRV